MLWEIALAILVGVFLWKCFQPEKYTDLPGPTRYPIFGSVLNLLGKSHSEIFDELVNFRTKFGNRVVIKAFNDYIVHIFDVNDIEVVLSHTKNIKKSKPYTFIEPWLGTGLLISTGSKWHRRRKILTPAFHFDILKNFTKVFEEHSRGLVDALKTQVKQDAGALDLMPFVSDFTLFAICETAMGTQLNANESTAKVNYKNAVLEIGHIVIKRLMTFYLHNPLVFGNLSIGKRFNENLKKVHSFADDVIMERKKQIDGKELIQNDSAVGEKRRLALLDLLLEAERRGEIDLEGIREEVNTFMFEGHDTTAIAIAFGLVLLADSEEVQERMYEECVSVFGSDPNRVPTPADFADMKYLEAVTKEILRLYPSVPFIGREVVEDFKLGNVDVTAGSEVIVHIYAVQRTPEIFPDPDAFKPERFLSGETRHPYAYVPFSAGPRNCIGQRFAKLEMKYFLSEIIRNFKMQPIRAGFRPRLKADVVLRADEPLYVKFIPR